jgi:FkbM family methyltransferase
MCSPETNNGEFLTHLPFSRTLKQIGETGFVRTVSMLIAVALKGVSTRLRYLPKSAIVEVNNCPMLLYPRKGAIHFELFVFKKREPICTDYLQKSGILKKCEVALDIGANIGYYALLESQLVGTQGKVYAVEPVKENLELLKKNVQLNKAENIHSYHLALGETNATAKIYVSTSVNLCSMNKDTVGGKLVGEEIVPVQTVDSFLIDKEPPKLIRMDVEGYEYEIFRGMSQTLKKDVRILIELHPRVLAGKLEDLLQILEQNNFKARFVVVESKVQPHKIMTALLKKGGDRTPIVYRDISVLQLKDVIAEYPELSPNVVFEKI